jgi:hypothetical protein
MVAPLVGFEVFGFLEQRFAKCPEVHVPTKMPRFYCPPKLVRFLAVFIKANRSDSVSELPISIVWLPAFLVCSLQGPFSAREITIKFYSNAGIQVFDRHNANHETFSNRGKVSLTRFAARFPLSCSALLLLIGNAQVKLISFCC